MVYGTTIKNLRNTIDVRLVSNENNYLQWTSYMSHKVVDNHLVEIRKSKVKLALNKHIYVGMCILN